jgi:hypothetical protein
MFRTSILCPSSGQTYAKQAMNKMQAETTQYLEDGRSASSETVLNFYPNTWHYVSEDSCVKNLYTPNSSKLVAAFS